MARLIVLDASFAIAALAASDAHHAAARAALEAATDDDLVMAATTRAEVLLGPARHSPSALSHATAFTDACLTVPVTDGIADRAVGLRVRHRSLSLPDAITLAIADIIDADRVWTFDRRWATVDARAAAP